MHCKTFIFLLFLFFSESIGKVAFHRGFYNPKKIPYAITEENLYAALQSDRKQPAKMTTVLLYTNHKFNKKKCTEYGIRILNTTDTLVLVRCPQSVVPYLKVIEGITHVGQSEQIIPLMDTSRILCTINEAHSAQPPAFVKGPFTGSNVLVGIIDTEFDTRHPAFLDSSNQTRFVAIWDQNDSTEKTKNKYNYGTIKSHNRLLIDTVFGSKGHFHGTLTAGAAVGSEWKSGYYGAAPGAKIIGVCYNNENSYSVLNGIQWIFSIADSLNLPCVINMSLGISSGPHDGTSEIDKIVDQLSGPGRIVVGAAGNDGEARTHAQFTLARNSLSGTWVTPHVSTGNNETKAYWGIDLWGEPQQQFSVTTQLYSTSTNELIEDTISISTILSVNYKPDTIIWNGDSFFFSLGTERFSILNGKPHARILASGSNPDIRLGVRVSSGSATTIHAWNMYKKSLENLEMTGYVGGDNNYSINEIGGTAKKIIAVGSYQIRSGFKIWDGTMIEGWGNDTILQLAGFSGRGPTVDGRVKPDITAPGVKVFSAISYYAADWGQTVYWPNHPNPYGRYGPVTGTSISSPIVAGVVALLLQANPKLTPDGVRNALQSSAITDHFTGPITAPNNTWGAGKLNAFGALKVVLGITERASNSHLARNKGTFNVRNGFVILEKLRSVNDIVRIADLQGRIIAQYRSLVNGQIPVPEVPGVYTVAHISGNKLLQSQQIIISK